MLLYLRLQLQSNQVSQFNNTIQMQQRDDYKNAPAVDHKQTMNAIFETIKTLI